MKRENSIKQELSEKWLKCKIVVMYDTTILQFSHFNKYYSPQTAVDSPTDVACTLYAFPDDSYRNANTFTL